MNKIINARALRFAEHRDAHDVDEHEAPITKTFTSKNHQEPSSKFGIQNDRYKEDENNPQVVSNLIQKAAERTKRPLRGVWSSTGHHHHHKNLLKPVLVQ